MAFPINEYPYTDQHELNMDWILKQTAQNTQAVNGIVERVDEIDESVEEAQTAAQSARDSADIATEKAQDVIYALADLDYADTQVTGIVVTAVRQSDGQISVQKQTIDEITAVTNFALTVDVSSYTSDYYTCTHDGYIRVVSSGTSGSVTIRVKLGPDAIAMLRVSTTNTIESL